MPSPIGIISPNLQFMIAKDLLLEKEEIPLICLAGSRLD